MRTTLTIEDGVAKQLRKLARRSDKTFNQVVNEVLKVGIQRSHRRKKRKSVKLIAKDLGKVRPGYDLNKALAIAGELEDAEILSKARFKR